METLRLAYDEMRFTLERTEAERDSWKDSCESARFAFEQEQQKRLAAEADLAKAKDGYARWHEASKDLMQRLNQAGAERDEWKQKFEEQQAVLSVPESYYGAVSDAVAEELERAKALAHRSILSEKQLRALYKRSELLLEDERYCRIILEENSRMLEKRIEGLHADMRSLNKAYNALIAAGDFVCNERDKALDERDALWDIASRFADECTPANYKMALDVFTEYREKFRVALADESKPRIGPDGKWEETTLLRRASTTTDGESKP